MFYNILENVFVEVGTKTAIIKESMSSRIKNFVSSTKYYIYKTGAITEVPA